MECRRLGRWLKRWHPRRGVEPGRVPGLGFAAAPPGVVATQPGTRDTTTHSRPRHLHYRRHLQAVGPTGPESPERPAARLQVESFVVDANGDRYVCRHHIPAIRQQAVAVGPALSGEIDTHGIQQVGGGTHQLRFGAALGGGLQDHGGSRTLQHALLRNLYHTTATASGRPVARDLGPEAVDMDRAPAPKGAGTLSISTALGRGPEPQAGPRRWRWYDIGRVPLSRHVLPRCPKRRPELRATPRRQLQHQLGTKQLAKREPATDRLRP